MHALRLVAALLCLCAVPATGMAQTVEQFYRGRTVSIVVGFNTGGAYDPYARLFARHLPNHLPGAPAVVVKNMQGAGSVIAANHLYNVSPKDGSELGVIAGSAAIEPVFGNKSTQFDGQKFTWLGSANEEIAGCLAWHESPFHSVEDLFGKEMVTGASGASNLEFPTAMNVVLGTRMKLVRGYNGPAAILLAYAAPQLDPRQEGAHPGADRARTHRPHGPRSAVRHGPRKERGRQARAAADLRLDHHGATVPRPARCS
jgi:hypothetical protein